MTEGEDSGVRLEGEARVWVVGETVWVWDTDAPDENTAEGDEFWNVFKAKIDRIELGKEDLNEHSLKCGKNCKWVKRQGFGVFGQKFACGSRLIDR